MRTKIIMVGEATRRTTIGAIDGYFPTRSQRKLNAQLADLSIGAEMARAADVVMARPVPTYLGRCSSSDCGQQECGFPSATPARCRRCGSIVIAPGDAVGVA